VEVHGGLAVEDADGSRCHVGKTGSCRGSGIFIGPRDGRHPRAGSLRNECSETFAETSPVLCHYFSQVEFGTACTRDPSSGFTVLMALTSVSSLQLNGNTRHGFT